MTQKYILTIDQGTTSSRAIIFNAKGEKIAQAQEEFKQYYPIPGYVEHDPMEIWKSVLKVCRQAIAEGDVSAQDIAGLGITNQRETTVIWDRQTGLPIHPAIVWQDRRTSELCQNLTKAGHEEMVREKTGLLLDPYFSATKISWILDNVEGARSRANKGELAFGTIDCFLLWHLTEGQQHRTDMTNASRTALFNIKTQNWDAELLRLFNVPDTMLPEVLECCEEFGVVSEKYLGARLPVVGIAGDQHAATIGQACFSPGMIKSTYGTGAFLVMNTGDECHLSQHRLLTTIAYKIKGEIAYALEGSVFIAGAVVQWLRDGLGLINSAKESEAMAKQVDDTSGVYFVPAFTGLGAPHWQPDARGAILGLTRGTNQNHIVRAALESICYQTRDLMAAMAADGMSELTHLRVDGGMSTNHWLCQYLSDILGILVERPKMTETTSLGVAYLAGLHLGWYDSIQEIAEAWQCSYAFEPKLSKQIRTQRYQGWLAAIEKVKT